MSGNRAIDLLGKRVSLLYRMAGDPTHPFSEAVGVVQRVDRSGQSALLHVRKRNGDIVRVAEQDVVTLKLLP